MTAITCKTVSILQNRQKLPNSPFGSKNWHISEADGSKNHADGSTMGTDMQSIEMDIKMAKNESKTIKKHQEASHANSPLKLETEMAKLPEGWKRFRIKGKMCTHCKTHRLNPWTRELEKPPFGDLLRCLGDLRTKQLEVAMSSEQATWTAETAAETSSQSSTAGCRKSANA